jgi:4-carboxymuconolactone decarboxylase
MRSKPKPPQTHEAFVKRHPKLGRAWELLGEAGSEGPLGEKTARLVKLGVAVGALREGAVHSSVRRALAMGISREELQQVVAISASIVGLPAAAAAFTWIEDLAGAKERRGRRRASRSSSTN